ncbi:hypothetical protein [Paractinoplanes durhamensis]|nr:hypothetical protein [Actinoplanes durhamensis]
MWKTRLAALAVLTTTAGVGLAAPAYAAPLTNVSWSLSQPQPGTANVRYTWSFTTPSGGIIQSVTFTVPAATAGSSLTVPDVYGLTGGTAALSGTTVTYTVTAPAAVAAGTSILVSIDGFTNTTSTGPFTSTVTTVVGGTNTDTAVSGPVTISPSSTAVTVVVARSTAFSSDTTSFNMLMDPSVSALTDQTRAVNLTVATNAASGYVLNVKTSQPLTGTLHNTSQFTPVTGGMATGVATGAFSTGRFGYSLTASGVGAATSAPLTSGNYVGYTTGSGEDVVSATGPTNGDTVVITNRAKIDYSQRADNYTATVTYTVVPNY